MALTPSSPARSRKGICELVKILIFIAVAIIVLGVTVLMSKVYDYYGDVEGCRLSILTMAYTKLADEATGEKVFTPHCPRREITITKDQVYSRGQFDEELLKRKLAEEYRQCWYMMGEGAQPFHSEWLSGVYHCIVCSQIRYDDRLKTSLSKLQQPYTDVTGFYDYFTTTTMLDGGAGSSDLTYAKYILDSYPADKAGQKAFNAGSAPDAWGTYNFVRNWEDHPSKDTKLPVGNLMLVYVYFSRWKAGEDFYTVLLVPQDKLGDLKCEKTWN
jgi:hypothetical protein